MRKAKPIMIQGTMSNAGKSLLCAALCRIFHQDGYRVAPFKSQNMALNSFITDEGLEMGRAQVVQAEAACVKPSVLMNPILLKPTTDVGSQVIVNGEVRGNMRAADYFKYKTQLVPDILRAYDTLASEADIMVIEGAGSPAEINLKSADIVNMGMAKMASSPVLLVGDIDRGGVFAQLFGTVALLEPDERAMVKATVINKFRGDVSILAPGLDMLYDLVKVPCAGVVPYVRVDIDDEDSLSERLAAGVRKEIDIAVVSLPRISNFTDFSPFSRFSGVSLRYVKNLFELGSPDMILLPGTKSTISDLKWLRQNGLEAAILKAASRGTPVFGICGGLQMLGQKISDPYNTEGGGEIAGMGLLPIETVFAKEKTRTQTEGIFRDEEGLFAGLNGLYYRGYEIHMGQSGTNAPLIRSGNVWGSYIHGLFDENGIAEVIVRALYDRAGLEFDENAVFDVHEYRESQYDKLADAVRGALDMDMIYRIIEEGV
ncbi:MAG: cobyric acid synthase [Clostridia bacterium]|nr:cobyric acid synthase [Clostridia bacterium]MBQ4351086.1 cobyric acid synthase [Clostridia bacterium]